MSENDDDDDNDGCLLADGLEAALIGFAWPWQADQQRVAIYSVEKILDILHDRDGMTWDEAREFYDFNIVGAYVGPQTPIYVEDPTDDDHETKDV